MRATSDWDLDIELACHESLVQSVIGETAERASRFRLQSLDVWMHIMQAICAHSHPLSHHHHFCNIDNACLSARFGRKAGLRLSWVWVWQVRLVGFPPLGRAAERDVIHSVT